MGGCFWYRTRLTRVLAWERAALATYFSRHPVLLPGFAWEPLTFVVCLHPPPVWHSSPPICLSVAVGLFFLCHITCMPRLWAPHPGPWKPEVLILALRLPWQPPQTHFSLHPSCWPLFWFSPNDESPLLSPWTFLSCLYLKSGSSSLYCLVFHISQDLSFFPVLAIHGSHFLTFLPSTSLHLMHHPLSSPALA